METVRSGYSGTGPGEITPDGCAVELYRRLPAEGEPEIVAEALAPPASLLELGCGVGRLTKPLTTAGYAVTAVDESSAMLAHVPRGAARVVRSPIERLELGETFDVVLLASFLVHAPDPAVRRALLATCRRHVGAAGVVIIQREGVDWATRGPYERRLLDGVVRIVSTEDLGDGVRSLRAEYAFPDATWTQTFPSRSLTPAEFEQALTEAGLRLDRYLDDAHLWAAARPT